MIRITCERRRSLPFQAMPPIADDIAAGQRPSSQRPLDTIVVTLRRTTTAEAVSRDHRRRRRLAATALAATAALASVAARHWHHAQTNSTKPASAPTFERDPCSTRWRSTTATARQRSRRPSSTATTTQTLAAVTATTLDDEQLDVAAPRSIRRCRPACSTSARPGPVISRTRNSRPAITSR